MHLALPRVPTLRVRNGQTATGNKEPVLKVSRDNRCSVMFPTEVGEIFGVRAEMRQVVDQVTCRYHMDPATTGEGKRDETLVEVAIHWTGGTAVTATRLAGRLLSGASRGFEKLTGMGDEGCMAPTASCFSLS